MRYLFDKTTAISPTERHAVVMVFLYAFSTAGAYVVARTTADALFLARVGPDWLPLMYLASGCILSVISIVFAKLASRMRLKRIIGFTLLTLATITIMLCQVVKLFDHAFFLLAAIYLLAEVRGCLNTIQYGILVNESFAGRSGHHHITGLLGAAATIAGFVFGAVIAFEVHQIGTVNLLYVVAGLELLAVVPIALLPRKHRDRKDRDGSEPATGDGSDDSRGGLRAAARSPRVRGVAALVALTVVVGTLIEFQWKTSVARSFVTKEDQMASFFGLFHATVDLATGLILVIFTGPIIKRVGSHAALLVLPAALAASTLGVLFASIDRVALSAITLSKGCDVLKRSVNYPAILMLYAPLSDRPRRQAITLVSGIIKPSAEAVAALTIVGLAGIISTRAISYAVLSLLCVWLLLASQRSMTRAR